MFSAVTNQVRTSAQRSSREGATIDHIILHHCASTDGDGVVSMMVSGARQVSANYVVANDGRVIGVVDEGDRAWTSGSSDDGGRGAAWDRRSITFECANLSTDGWTISDASYESIARVCADVSRRYGFPLTRSGANSTVFGHRELYQYFNASYATACPGGMDIDRVVRRANEILAGVVPAPERTDTRVMISYHFQDRAGRSLAPGATTRLKDAKGADVCVISKAGPDYSITPHLVAEGGQPGDSVELVLVWQNGTKVSPHYPVRGVADASGKVALSPEFKRAVNEKDAVYVQVSAPATNKGTFKVTILDSDAYLFSR